METTYQPSRMCEYKDMRSSISPQNSYKWIRDIYKKSEKLILRRFKQTGKLISNLTSNYLSGYWCNKHLIELHKLQVQDCKSFLRTKLPTTTASSQLRTPDLATTTRTWLKDNKETGMCPAALAAGRVRPRPRPPKTPEGWPRPLTGQLGSGRSEVEDPGEVAEHVHWRRALLRTPTPLQLRQRRTRRRSLPPPRADDPNLGWTTGGTFAGIAEEPRGWDNKGWSHTRQPLWCSDLSIPFKISKTRYIQNEYVRIW